MDYIYTGDRLARMAGIFAGRCCNAARRPDGKCIRGRNGNMLVVFESGKRAVVPGRQLRKTLKNKTV